MPKAAEKAAISGLDEKGHRRKPRIDQDEYLAKMLQRSIDADGRFYPDNIPMAPPVGYRKTPSIIDLMHQAVRETISRQAAEMGYETFEEADDFDVGDEPEEMRSGWENDFDPSIAEVVQEVEKARKPKKGVSGEKSPEGEPATSQEPVQTDIED